MRSKSDLYLSYSNELRAVVLVKSSTIYGEVLWLILARKAPQGRSKVDTHYPRSYSSGRTLTGLWKNFVTGLMGRKPEKGPLAIKPLILIINSPLLQGLVSYQSSGDGVAWSTVNSDRHTCKKRREYNL